MDAVVLIGRILLGILALSSGIGGHFGNTDPLAGYAESRGVKGARPLVLISGAMLLAAGVMLILGIYAGPRSVDLRRLLGSNGIPDPPLLDG